MTILQNRLLSQSCWPELEIFCVEVPDPQDRSTRLQAADLQLDLVRREARRGEHVLQLTPQEFSLLQYLCRNAGRVVTRSMILDHVWRMKCSCHQHS